MEMDGSTMTHLGEFKSTKQIHLKWGFERGVSWSVQRRAARTGAPRLRGSLLAPVGPPPGLRRIFMEKKVFTYERSSSQSVHK
jgi:hypothetical protein